MKRFYYLIPFYVVFLSGCGDSAKENEEPLEINNTEEVDSGPLDVRAKRHVESVLKIPATEKYSIKIYRADLDGDNKEDGIITVNRLEFAHDEAAASGNTAKRAELGFMGNYNYFFYYDGGLDKISPEIPVPSTPQKELKVTFENISSDMYKDVVIEFRIRNASYKDFFVIANHTPRRVFQWKVFDGLKSKESEAYHFVFDEGTMGLQKDILVMKGELIQPDSEVDELTYEPEIRKDNELLYRFFYNPQMGKYATRKQ